MKILSAIKSAFTQLGIMVYMIICGVFLLITFGVMGYYLLLYARGEVFVTGNGNNNIGFEVHYLENPLWESGAIDHSYHFLMSFVDHIHVNSFGNVNFSATMDVDYTYTVTETLLIRAGSGSDTSNHPIVYSRSYTLEETEGHFTSRNMSFGNTSTNITAGGAFDIDPIRHIQTYTDFMVLQHDQMADRNLQVAGGRVFSAELVIETVFRFTATDTEDLGVSFNNQTLTNGYRIALSNEVFNMSHIETGTSTFSGSQALGLAREITTTNVGLLSGSILVNTLGIFYCFSLMGRDKNKLRYKTLRYIKKYSHEVLVLPEPLDLPEENIKPVTEFDDILKMAVNLNKHISCYHNRRFADFAVEVESIIYHYHVSFTLSKSPSPPERPNELVVQHWEDDQT